MYKLQITQYNIQRIILNKTRDFHVNNLYEELNILIVKKLFYKATVTFLVKNNLLEPITHNFNTRGK